MPAANEYDLFVLLYGKTTTEQSICLGERLPCEDKLNFIVVYISNKSEKKPFETLDFFMLKNNTIWFYKTIHSNSSNFDKCATLHFVYDENIYFQFI